MITLNKTAMDRITEIITRLRHKPGALLPILHEIQGCIGYIPAEAVPLIATGVNQSITEVDGVISFYHDFRCQPPAKHQVQLCRAEACQSVGARQLESHAKKLLGIEFNQATKDNKINLNEVYCLGNCACGPSVRINDSLYGRVTAEKFTQLMGQLKHLDNQSE